MNMKTKFVKVGFIAVIVMMGGMNVFNAQKTVALSEVALANVEALANGEYDNNDCVGNQEYSSVSKALGTLQEFFHTNDGKDRVNIYEVERCFADGNGTLSGTNGIFSKLFIRSEEITCTGLCRNNILW